MIGGGPSGNGDPRSEAWPGLRCLIAERTWAALGFAFPGVALPKKPLRQPYTYGEPWGVMTTTTCPNQNIAVSFLRNSTGALPPRPDILYPDGQACTRLYTTHCFPLFTPPHVALISARLDRGISPVRSVSLASHSTAGQPLNIFLRIPPIPPRPIHRQKVLAIGPHTRTRKGLRTLCI